MVRALQQREWQATPTVRRGVAAGQKRPGPGRWLWCVALCAVLPLQAGEVLDRAVAVAGSNVITLSAVHRALRLKAFVDNRPVDESPGAKREAVEQLINSALIRREIELSRYDPPAMSEAEARIETLLKERKATADSLREHLERLGLDEDALKRHLLWAITVYRFVGFRFGQGQQLTEDEMRQYYREQYEKVLRNQDPNAKVEEFEVVRDIIREILTNLKANTALKQWIEATRAQANIRYLGETLE